MHNQKRIYLRTRKGEGGEVHWKYAARKASDIVENNRIKRKAFRERNSRELEAISSYREDRQIFSQHIRPSPKKKYEMTTFTDSRISEENFNGLGKMNPVNWLARLPTFVLHFIGNSVSKNLSYFYVTFACNEIK